MKRLLQQPRKHLATRRCRAAGLRWLSCSVVVLVLAGCGGGSSTEPAPKAALAAARDTTQSVVRQGVAMDLAVVEMTKVSETRVARTTFDYVYRVTVRNTGASAYRNVVLTLTSAAAGASIVDGTIALGSIGAAAQVSPTDTVTIRQDRSVAFDPAALVWQITGDAVTAPQDPLAQLEASGAIPKLERSGSTGGIDGDGNGIRDDVDAYLAAQYADARQRAAAFQVAKAVQATLQVDPANGTAAKAASVRVSNAVNCVFAQFPGGTASKEPGRVVSEIESITTNTKQRLLTYLAYKKALDGTASALPAGDTCE